LVALRKEGFPRAIGSSTPRQNLETIFAATGLVEFFDAVVCGDDVANGKPSPDVFLLAAQKLSLLPADCLVIEDAHAGIEAARRAGIPVLAVATTNPLANLAYADGAVESLTEASPALLCEIHARFSLQNPSLRACDARVLG
jgi:beta-phosphoglucomutase-like phosphatase (HAD superfamily)